MSLTINETFRVDAAPDRVWQFLKNPAEVVTCLPGAELTETIDAQTYGGRVKVKVGPITAAYAGKATLTQVDDAARRMQIVGEGKESGGSGSARMTMTGVVTPLPDGGSEVSVDAVVDVAGRVMQFGRGLIESVNKQLFRQFAESVQAKLATPGGAVPAPADSAGEAPTVPPPPGGGGAAPPSIEPTAASLSASAGEAPAPPPAGRTSAAAATTPRADGAIAKGEELRALPLLWKVFVSWLRRVFGGKR
ncbi:MAG TPA: SRPBCC family protein [Gemmatimonadaceae bacterium]|nr:SRPBCC family protein [Gemmatimonadaceae bacterium]